MKEGVVLLIGRPNVGKSTFVNNVIGQKVAITSPKPQTTRSPIKALLNEERGNILFIDTPGIIGKAQDYLSKKINERTMNVLHEKVNIVIYMVDHTRRRDFEEGRVLGFVRQINKPKLLVINKIDLQEKSYLPQYKFLEDEFPDIYAISAITRKHFKPLLDKIFELLPEVSESEMGDDPIYPLINMDSYGFIAELIREKVFLKMGEEIPYTTTAIVDEITERTKKITYIKARILTTEDRYKRMIIGHDGHKIKELGSMSRKEIELAMDRKIFLDLTVETDPHWQEVYYK
ncbi:MAG: GTPase Era [Candidatus Roizmanbacteria bacterium]